ncbi:hypothetical protein [Streptomyces sp. NPDC097619]|uniref:hypothetical protein n=1 Tax=Streptomyces sp. NPDC097619 TaxID=3157228 RepID=UPI0033306E53
MRTVRGTLLALTAVLAVAAGTSGCGGGAEDSADPAPAPSLSGVPHEAWNLEPSAGTPSRN